MTTATTTQMTVRRCAREIADLWDSCDDFDKFSAMAQESLAELLKRPDLLLHAIPSATHRINTWLLYCDGELTFQMGHEARDVTVPIHDHGMWEMLGIYHGKVDHGLYERVDDGSIEGRAELRETDRRILAKGDTVMLRPPPNDLHGFTALTSDQLILAVVPGFFPDVRRYFDMETGTYIFHRRTPV